MLLPLLAAISLSIAPVPQAVGPAVAAAADDHGGRVFDASRNARADVRAALGRAEADGRMTMIVLGGNWCHDSRALGAWLTSERFQRELSPLYEIVFVDVGQRDRNLDVPGLWAVTGLEGTPTVLIIGADEQLLNRTTAASWRNAASRKASAVLRYFRQFSADDPR